MVSKCTPVPKADKDIIREENYRPNISCELTCKHPQQSISKSNPTMYKQNYPSQPSGFILGMQGCFKIPKSINITHHINRLIEKKHNYINRCIKSI